MPANRSIQGLIDKAASAAAADWTQGPSVPGNASRWIIGWWALPVALGLFTLGWGPALVRA